MPRAAPAEGGRREPGAGVGRLRWRITDLLAHVWDLARATGIAAEPPGDLVEQALAFARNQLPGRKITGQFAEPQTIQDTAPAIDQLAALTGRPVSWGR